MKISILSRSTRLYSTNRLREAIQKRGHTAYVHDTLKFSMLLEKERPSLYYRHLPLPELDAVIPRIGASVTYFGVAVVRQFEQMGIYTANESTAIARSRDKLRAMQVLSRHDIGIPPTVFVRDRAEVLPAIERIGGPPIILKILEGTQGVGVILADTVRMAEAIVETLISAKQNVLIQKFVAESRGRDIRAFVVGDRVVAAMRRCAEGDEYRSNVHRGGRTESIQIDPDYARTAVRASQIMGLRIAGVDMLEGNDGPQVVEVNSSPGLEGIEETTGIDIADAIVSEVENNLLFPDVDLKQRLLLTAGYGIVEFPVHDMPEIEGRALRETTLSKHNIHVLSITRHKAIIPNPKGDSVVHRGDVLLCYGELTELRKLIPAPDARHPHPKHHPSG